MRHVVRRVVLSFIFKLFCLQTPLFLAVHHGLFWLVEKFAESSEVDCDVPSNIIVS